MAYSVKEIKSLMAIETKILKKKLAEPLSKEELEMVKQTEDYIDSIITKQGAKDRYSIDLSYATFSYHPVLKNNTFSIHHKRKQKMRKELESRFKKAGWKISVEIDDMLDGPNMSGGDYWTISIK